MNTYIMVQIFVLDKISWNHITANYQDMIEIIDAIIMGGARGVMVIVIGNGHVDMSSNPGWDWLHFT